MIYAVKESLSKRINKIMIKQENLMVPLEYTLTSVCLSVCLCDWSGNSKSKRVGRGAFDCLGQRHFEQSLSEADRRSLCWPVRQRWPHQSVKCSGRLTITKFCLLSGECSTSNSRSLTLGVDCEFSPSRIMWLEETVWYFNWLVPCSQRGSVLWIWNTA